MRMALELIIKRNPNLAVDGEMQGSLALDESIRDRIFPAGRLTGAANLLILPNLDAANICVSVVRQLADGLTIGPILMGAAMPVHIGVPSISVRGLLNLTAIAAVDAGLISSS